MRRDPRKYLHDMRHAVERIRRFTEGKSFQQYLANDLLQSAVERQFEIIGEAANQLSRVDPAVAGQLSDLPRMVAFRNMLIHGYAVVDPRVVWGVVEGKLPELHRQLNQLLD